MKTPKNTFILLALFFLALLGDALAQVTTITTTGTTQLTTNTGISTATTSVTSTVRTSTVTTGVTTSTDTVSVTGTTTTDVNSAIRAEAPGYGALFVAGMLAFCALMI